jgi:8-oxo-dGTP pyrophosphatase MutT (NUDIX family)
MDYFQRKEERIGDYTKNQLTVNGDFVYLDEELLGILYNGGVKKKRYRNIYCVNCGEKGHVVKECHGPITSFGIMAFKVVNNSEEERNDYNSELANIVKKVKEEKYIIPQKAPGEDKYPKIKFLMIQRKDTMGYIDFVRGKYPEDEEAKKGLLMTFLNEMTVKEKENLLTKSFDEIWRSLWLNPESRFYRNEYESAKKKYSKLNIRELVRQSTNSYDFTELSFAKGRRNMKETNIACAEREFFEETGYDKSCYDFIKHYPTIHEEFVGTNGVKYRHIYYLVKMKGDIPPPRIDKTNIVQMGEVKNIGWFTVEECLSLIRPYDIAKKDVIRRVNYDLLNMNGEYECSNFYYTSRSEKSCE